MLKDSRISRIHTESNELVSLASLFQWTFRSPLYLYEKMVKRSRGARPWWPVNCIGKVERLIGKESKVLEFGSGSSTIWFAKRVAYAIAVEDSYDWYVKVNERLRKENIINAKIMHRTGDEYFNIQDEVASEIDLFVVDGSYRWRCIENIIPVMKVGSTIYLDNSDSDKDICFYPPNSEKKMAQKLMIRSLDTGKFRYMELHGMIDGEFFGGSGAFLTRIK